MEKLYKILGPEGKNVPTGGSVAIEYSLPKKKGNKWIPGKWMPEIPKERCILCASGYHLAIVPAEHLVNGSKIYIAEAKEIVDRDESKVVCTSVRLLELVTMNTGRDNTGECNSGDRNSGNSNSGTGHFGAFNTGVAPRLMFNKPISEEEYQRIDWPMWTYIEVVEWIESPEMVTGGYVKAVEYKTAWKNAFDKADKEGILAVTKLPNFDYVVFEEITGITKKMITARIK